MRIYKLIDRFIMVAALIGAVTFLKAGEAEAAVAAIALWPISRAMASVLDVFYLFFTERPLLCSHVPAGEIESNSI